MASALPPILVEIQADVASLKKGLDDAKNAINGLSSNVAQGEKSMTRYLDKIKQVGATLGVAFAGTQVISFFKESINAANEASAAQERLTQLLLTTNGGTREQIAALIDQADALEKVGVVSKNNIIVAQSQLATFDLTASTIRTLTPAIADYVTAEKGAAATAEDFKMMTNGLAQALNGNFASLTRTGFVLDEATKKMISSGTESQRAAAIVKVLSSTYEGFNENLRDTNPIQVAINEFGNFQEDIGKALLPAVEALSRFFTDQLLPALRALGRFIKNNADAIKAFVIVLGTAYAGLKLYRGMIILTTAAKKAYQVATTLVRGAQLASIASTNTLAASMLRLNAIMRANIFGIIVTAVAALSAAIVVLWKRSETFRNVVISVGKAGLNAFASIIPMVARVAEAVIRLLTGPMRAFLGLLSKFPPTAKIAKAGLDLVNKGIDGISDLGDKASTKARELAANLDKLGKSAKDNGKKIKDVVDPFAGGGDDKGGGLTDKEKAKLKDYKERVKDYYRSIKEVIKDAQGDFADLNEDLLEDQNRYAKREADARKRNAENIIRITKEYNKRRVDLETSYEERIADLQARAAERRVDANNKAATREMELTEQSMDRLRNAFASGLNFDLASTLQRGGGIAGALRRLKKQLDEARTLQANAAALAGAGYSQTFIEEIVKAGPRVGNRMAKSLLAATPESTKEVQSLFAQIESISESGMDGLAGKMNEGGKLATTELRKAYSQVAIDLKDSLAEIDAELTKSMAEQNRDFMRAMSDAALARDEAIADSLDSLNDALIDAQDALLEAQKDYEKAVDKLNLSTQEKLKELKRGIKEVAADMTALGAPQAGQNAINRIPTFTPFTPTATTTAPTTNNVTNNNIKIEQNTHTDPIETANAVLYAQKYGQVIQVR